MSQRSASRWSRRRWLGAIGSAAWAPAAWAEPAPPGQPVQWPALEWIAGDAPAPGSFDGVPVVVVFWASWCALCKRHNAHIDRLYRAVDPQRLRVVTVAVASDVAAVRNVMSATGYRFPVALDRGLLRPRLSPRRMIPLTCTIDRSGRVGLCIPGEMAADDVVGLASLALPAPR